MSKFTDLQYWTKSWGMSATPVGFLTHKVVVN